MFDRITIRTIPLYLMVVAIVLVAEPRAPWAWIGLGLAAVGQWLRFWAFGHLQKNAVLTTSGPYAHSQHPAYFASMLMAIGFLVFAGSPAGRGFWVWVIGFPVVVIGYFILYFPRKRAREGERLSRKFGVAYDDWASAVPLWWPRLRPYEKRDRQTRWSFALSLENNEHGTFLVAVATFAAAWWLSPLVF
ncbi:MAG: isoprenylcysteine carboxylmethyltransferase family protein [Planctomycetes bacterium]|nr:isoprenylcysteine carboxylmethyltransferase family protein [Planctomycetota bacterium]